MSRRIEALKNLAERGATEGEREAARKALEIHMHKAGASERSQTSVPPFRSDTGDWSTRHDDFLDTLFRNAATAPRNAATGPRFWKPFETGPTTKTYRTGYSSSHARKNPVYGSRVDFITVDDMPTASREPLDTAHTSPRDRRTVRIEVATEEEMRRRHRNDFGPHRFTWQGKVCTTPHYNGFSIEDGRCYLLISRSSFESPKTWPEAVDVDDHPTEQARARLEVSTRAEMFSRFRESKPITIRWRSQVWRTEGFAGTCEDKSVYPPRFYLTINTARLTRL